MKHPVFNIALVIGLLLAWATTQFQPILAAREQHVVQLDQAPFGINTHLGTRYPDLASMGTPADLVARSGAGWAREDIHWFRIQPSSSTWDWSYSDAAMRELIRRKIHIVGVIGHPPGWATPHPGDDPAGISFYAPDPQRFAAFSAAVVKRYGKYVRHWEIWNEPDNPLFWKPAPDPVAYALLLRLTSAAIHQIDPGAQILIGGLNPFDTTFLRRVAESGAWPSFDIIALHPYVNPDSPESGNMLASADAINALASRYGAKPLWATEVGWSSGPGDRDKVGKNNAQDQANYLVRATLLLWRAGFERIFWYTLKDDPGNPYGMVSFGTGYADYSQIKPAFLAFRTLSRELGGASFVGMRDLFERTTVQDFETFGVWRRGDQPNGTLTSTSAFSHTGRAAAQLSYTFPSPYNDYVVFRRDRAAPIPGSPYAIGIWVYGDSSGHALKVWLRDAEGEILQYTLGNVGPSGWHFLQTPINIMVPPWNRITNDGNGRMDFPARLEAIVLDDTPDSFRGSGTIYLDDLVVLSGPEAYNLQLNQGNVALDVLWAPMPLRASIHSTSASAQVVDWGGSLNTVSARNGRIELDLGAAPIYVRHTR